MHDVVCVVPVTIDVALLRRCTVRAHHIAVALRELTVACLADPFELLVQSRTHAGVVRAVRAQAPAAQQPRRGILGSNRLSSLCKLLGLLGLLGLLKKLGLFQFLGLLLLRLLDLCLVLARVGECKPPGSARARIGRVGTGRPCRRLAERQRADDVLVVGDHELCDGTGDRLDGRFEELPAALLSAHDGISNDPSAPVNGPTLALDGLHNELKRQQRED
mmetsp:Transcript_33499/g.95924  ORF Transcript_33499/g.95924 Transcript_33499/m.95924 type:complete len:219 (-) Transcript_33499:212-868(-)